MQLTTAQVSRLSKPIGFYMSWQRIGHDLWGEEMRGIAGYDLWKLDNGECDSAYEDARDNFLKEYADNEDNPKCERAKIEKDAQQLLECLEQVDGQVLTASQECKIAMVFLDAKAGNALSVFHRLLNPLDIDDMVTREISAMFNAEVSIATRRQVDIDAEKSWTHRRDV
jgi:hypothetical protein